jgi:hypothetical protein
MMGLSEHIDVHGNPKEPPKRITAHAAVAWLGIGLSIEVLIWGWATGAWSQASTLAGYSISYAGTIVLGWDVLLTYGDQVLEREGVFAGRGSYCLGVVPPRRWVRAASAGRGGDDGRVKMIVGAPRKCIAQDAHEPVTVRRG